MKSHIHPAMFLHYLLLFFVLPAVCISTDTMTPTRPLRDGDLLVSKESKFALGFFNPQNSTLRYVGVWYNTIPKQTVVWLLNRDHPVNDTSGVLSIDMSGNIHLHRGNSTHVWSTNVSISSPNATVAQLLDTGNLVLIDGKRVVWRGFDYPTDTLIPFMELGQDRRSGFDRFLTSWKSPTDPGTGDYSGRINATGSPQMILYKDSERIWRAGHWNGLQWSGLPVMNRFHVIKVILLNDQDEISYMFTMVKASVLSKVTVTPDGYVERTIWYESEGKWSSVTRAPGDQCDRYGHCGPNSKCDDTGIEFECTCLAGFEPASPRDWMLRDGSGGCLRKDGAQENMCRGGEGFVKVESTKPPDTSTARVNMSMSLEGCGKECLKDCSCRGYAAANVSGSGCLSWHGELMDTKVLRQGGQDFYVRVDAITHAENQKRSKGFLAKKGVMAGLAVGAALLMLFLIASCYFSRKKMKGKGRQNKMLSNWRPGVTWLQDSTPGAMKQDETTTTESELQFFDLNTIAAATNDFSSEMELGRGGFGSVYKGRLSNGQEIAIKRLAKNSGQGKVEFKNEVVVIAKLQHRNLVRLLGCCIQDEEKILVYEYLPNKSLDSFIFSETKKSLLDWRKRFEIIIGIARGILYLHQDSRLRIIHRDLKASNILLDIEMLPKISDFGMARIFGGNQIQGNTNRVVGTYGYMSPEYAMEGLFSTKSDVYSFGVLLLEIITGRKNSSYCEDSPFLNLVGNVWSLWKEDKAMDIIDPSLDKSYPTDEVLRCIQVGLLCVQDLAIDRPNISTIILMLGNNSALPFPKQPAYTSNRIDMSKNLSSSGEGLLSLNNITQTSVQAR